MSANAPDLLLQVLQGNHQDILAAWLHDQVNGPAGRQDLMSRQELEQQSRELLALVQQGAESRSDDTAGAGWAPVRDYLAGISRTRALQGFTPTETATFVFSLKQALFRQLQQAAADDPAALARETWRVTELVDALGLYSVDQYQRSREEVIRRQQQEIMELSTPVVRLWEGVVAVPVIGTLDSARTQVVMESLLERIVETGAELAIIDITGVPTVDTLVAQHLIKTVAAARLMGADCIISGIRPQIAQTIVHLGINLDEVTTKASLADAMAAAFARLGITLHRA